MIRIHRSTRCSMGMSSGRGVERAKRRSSTRTRNTPILCRRKGTPVHRQPGDSKGRANKENAEKFIDYILKPEVSVKISKVSRYES